MPKRINDKLISWASDVEQGTIRQAEKTARLPIVDGHVALMPDAHVGIGATVGSVIPTDGAVFPSAVGVDIGCGMIAVETDLSASQLPDDLQPYLTRVERVVPAGMGQGHSRASSKAHNWMAVKASRVELTARQESKSLTQFLSYGSGNHFFEVCLDERQQVGVVLHSGSRGIGNELAQGH